MSGACRGRALWLVRPAVDGTHDWRIAQRFISLTPARVQVAVCRRTMRGARTGLLSFECLKANQPSVHAAGEALQIQETLEAGLTDHPVNGKVETWAESRAQSRVF